MPRSSRTAAPVRRPSARCRRGPVLLLAGLLWALGAPLVAAPGSEDGQSPGSQAGAGHGGHSHTHDGPPGAPIHFAHPLITESPSPDTKLRVDGFRFDGDRDTDQLRLVGEVAFHPTFSLEVDLPWTSVDPDTGLGIGDSTSALGNVGLGLKFANFAFADRGLLLGYGIEFGLPTGDDEKGIGSDNVFEIAPLLSLGYQRRAFELVTFLEFGIPTNQDEAEGQEVETELEVSLSLLYHLSPRFQVLLETDGETVLSGEEEGESVVHFSPGFKVRPAAGSPLWVGLGLGFPVSDDEEFDTRVVGSVFYHF